MDLSSEPGGQMPKRNYRPRMLPALLVAGTALFGFKIVAVWQGTETLIATLGTPAVAAEEPKPEKPHEVSAASIAKPESAPAAMAAPDATAAAEPSASELEVLQSLAKRRDELSGRERALDMRETMLKAAEQRVDQKIVRLTALEGEIQKLVAKNDEVESARIKSLVKVYESMKPQDAARIFEKLDRAVLLDVAERMKETKMAPILAAMDAGSAQAVTVALATRRKLPDEQSVADQASGG